MQRFHFWGELHEAEYMWCLINQGMMVFMAVKGLVFSDSMHTPTCECRYPMVCTSEFAGTESISVLLTLGHVFLLS